MTEKPLLNITLHTSQSDFYASSVSGNQSIYSNPSIINQPENYGNWG